MATIRFQKVEEFAEFVAAQPALGDAKKCVFLSEEGYGVRRCRGYGQDASVDFKYHALVPVVEMKAFMQATLDLGPSLPNDWATMDAKGLLTFSCCNKKELVEFLKTIEVKESEIKKLNKTSVSTLKEIVDNSPTQVGENEEFEEIVYKLKQKGDIVKLNSAKFGEVKLTLGREGNRELVYRCRADWGVQLAALMSNVEKELKKKKLQVVRGTVDLR